MMPKPFTFQKLTFSRAELGDRYSQVERLSRCSISGLYQVTSRSRITSSVTARVIICHSSFVIGNYVSEPPLTTAASNETLPRPRPRPECYSIWLTAWLILDETRLKT
jgi:hypothetical protein